MSARRTGHRRLALAKGSTEAHAVAPQCVEVRYVYVGATEMVDYVVTQRIEHHHDHVHGLVLPCTTLVLAPANGAVLALRLCRQRVAVRGWDRALRPHEGRSTGRGRPPGAAALPVLCRPIGKRCVIKRSTGSRFALNQFHQRRKRGDGRHVRGVDGQLLVDKLDQVHAWRVAAHTDDAAAPPRVAGRRSTAACATTAPEASTPGIGHPRHPSAPARGPARPSSAALIVALAPNSLASASRGADRSTASTSAPIARARSNRRQPDRAYSEDDQPFGTVSRAKTPAVRASQGVPWINRSFGPRMAPGA